MGVSNRTVTLEANQLSDLDQLILDYLRDEGRATPTLLKIELEEDGHDPGVRQNVNNCLTRLREHDHVVNLHDTGVYELGDDPRDGDT